MSNPYNAGAEDPLDAYNKLAKTNSFHWSSVSLDELPESTYEYVDMWLVRQNIAFQLHRPVIGNVFVFKVDGGPVAYLVHNANTAGHMWGDKNFDNLDNNTALAELLSKKTGIKDLKRLFDMIDIIQNAPNN